MNTVKKFKPGQDPYGGSKRKPTVPSEGPRNVPMPRAGTKRKKRIPKALATAGPTHGAGYAGR